MAGRAGSVAAAALLFLACGVGGCERPARDASPAVTVETPSDGREPRHPAGERGAARRGADRRERGARRARSVKRVEGTLSSASDRWVVIQPRDRPLVTVRIGPGTSVTLDGRHVRGGALHEGAEVRAAYRTGADGRPTAVAIDARAARGAPPLPSSSDPSSTHLDRHARPDEP